MLCTGRDLKKTGVPESFYFPTCAMVVQFDLITAHTHTHRQGLVDDV